MTSRHLSLAVLLTLCLSYAGSVLAADRAPRSCGSKHESLTIPPGGMGGTGHEAVIPPGGMGGTGITAGYLSTVRGSALAQDQNNQRIQLANGDAICVGDHIASGYDSKAKILLTDGAALHILNSTVIRIDDYHYSAQAPEQGRSLITLAQGNIRSVSGTISKTNPKDYRLQTPVASIRVIGTDFMVTHLPAPEEVLDAGTYTKVTSGEVSVQSASGTIHLHAGESSHVKLDGSQSRLSGSGAGSSGSCTWP